MEKILSVGVKKSDVFAQVALPNLVISSQCTRFTGNDTSGVRAFLGFKVF